MKQISLFILLVLTVGCVDKTANKTNIPVTGGEVGFSETYYEFFDRGLCFGAEHKVEIQNQIKIWQKLIQEELDLTPKELYNYVEANTGLIQACEKYSPELLMELKGMADGAEVTYHSLVNLNLAEEIILHFSQGYQSCTNIGVATAGGNYLAYNLDLPEFLRVNSPFIIRRQNSVIYGFPGILATGGMNKHFAVTTNSLPQNRMDKNGLPLPFMLRKLINAESLEFAKQLLDSIPLGAPQNFMIVSRDQIIDLEKSKNELVEATQNGTVVYHTNFPLKNTDTLQREKEVCQRYNYLKEVTNSGTVDKFSTKEGLTELLLNANPSTINNEETYLSFIAVFPKDINKPLEFYVLPSKYDINSKSIKL